MDWFSTTFGPTLHNLATTRTFDALPVLGEAGSPRAWHRIPSTAPLPFPGLFLAPFPALDALLALDERSYADLFFGSSGLDPTGVRIGDDHPRRLGDGFTARLEAALEGRLPGVDATAVQAFLDAGLRPDDVAVNGWLLPPPAVVPPAAAIHLETMKTRLERYQRLQTLKAPDLLLRNELRHLQTAQIELLRATRDRVLGSMGRGPDWRHSQQQLLQTLDALAPGERRFEADLQRGTVRWTAGPRIVEARGWLLGSHRPSDGSFQPGREVPGAAALPADPSLPRSAATDEEAFDLAWRHAQHAGLRLLYRVRQDDGTSLFLGLLEPTLVG